MQTVFHQRFNDLLLPTLLGQSDLVVAVLSDWNCEETFFVGEESVSNHKLRFIVVPNVVDRDKDAIQRRILVGGHVYAERHWFLTKVWLGGCLIWSWRLKSRWQGHYRVHFQGHPDLAVVAANVLALQVEGLLLSHVSVCRYGDDEARVLWESLSYNFSHLGGMVGEEGRCRGDVDFCSLNKDVGEVLHHRQDKNLLWMGGAGSRGGGCRTFWILRVKTRLGQIWERAAGSLGIARGKSVATGCLAHLLARSVGVRVGGAQGVDS